MILVPTLDADDAALVLAAGLAQARTTGAAVSIAVVDAAGVLLAFSRMDGARAHTVDLATRKARTAAATGLSTTVLGKPYADRPAPAG